MSDAADKLARTRLALINQMQRGERRPSRSAERRREREGTSSEESLESEPSGMSSEWFGHVRHALRTWWRYHPAHMGLDIATPALSAYGGRKPLQFLGIAAAVGALMVILRPWRLISLTGLLVALAKSSQLSGVLMSALSAADYRKDTDPYDE
jgi:hypothetical protein